MKYRFILFVVLLVSLAGALSAQSLQLNSGVPNDGAIIGYNVYNTILGGATGLTVEAWIRPASLVNSGTLRNSVFFISQVGNVGTINFTLTQNGKLQAIARSVVGEVTTSLVTANPVVTINNWYHIAAVVDFTGKTLELFVDGNSVAFGNRNFASNTYVPSGGTTSPDVIGIHTALNNTEPYEGLIDEVRVWNIPRTAQQIQDFMDNEIDVTNQALLTQEGLIGYWRMNEGSGLTASDASPSMRNATLVNGATFGPSAPIGGPITLPVELSSFTANFSINDLVVLHWITQSEIDVQGFYVLRNSSNDLQTAQMVSPLIEATNTSSQQSYSFQDTELFEPGQYYYWLQNLDFSGSSDYYGPRMVNVYFDEPTAPEITAIGGIHRIYPNPASSNTVIRYGVDAKSPVKIDIYNTKGQLVRSFNQGVKDAGEFNLNWNGQDDRGNDCPNGIYYVRMQTNRLTNTAKLLLMK